MAGEKTYPALPCADIDVIIAFYERLGFKKTYRQLRPNPYAVMQREDIHLHFFGMPNFKPEESYGTCIVEVLDADTLYQAFVEGFRRDGGKVPASGIPRMTRPRKKQDAVYGFSVVDPGGNWIRVSQKRAANDLSKSPDESSSEEKPPKGLAKALAQAIILGDSHGDAPMAIKFLETAITRNPKATTIERVQALLYLADLHIMDQEGETALRHVREILSLKLTADERKELKEDLERAAELVELLE